MEKEVLRELLEKETLKGLLKDNLKVETDTYWTFGKWRIVTRILFDGEIISEDFIEMDAV
jgi:hypothetical protein